MVLGGVIEWFTRISYHQPHVNNENNLENHQKL